MEWWEAPELDTALWRDYRPETWPGYRGKTPDRDWTERKWNEYYPLSGGYDFEVKERAVWRELELRRKRRQKR
jgi:hypothetical protein